ncbi:hypothetical protein ACSFA8_26745 [Variovorax sp. RT4R15]|uniref:hypothetical protein n=1 Tax=Variovorax sp. RT4R15 TaxID=3443737 RepID=UPI003F46F164
MNELASLRTWLDERIQQTFYAIEAMKGSSSTLVLPDCMERLSRYKQALLTLEEYDEFMRDSGPPLTP